MAVQLNSNLEFIVMIALAVILLIPLGYGVISSAASNDTQPFLEKPDEKYDKCVRDTEYMRLNHMDLLKSIRDEVIHEGKKAEVKLKDCRECHMSRERFCDKCHNVVNLQPNCFGCHYYP
ncbi:MAG: hypothetical protein E3J72_05490 [Planctomycetota bacterium]|nr:MAG: hypothetical protein E3J72_05490 [Planctomycetota bacterium]